METTSSRAKGIVAPLASPTRKRAVALPFLGTIPTIKGLLHPAKVVDECNIEWWSFSPSQDKLLRYEGAQGSVEARAQWINPS